jgi:paraquat-inducible protein B
MNRSTNKRDHSNSLPKPMVKAMRWPFPVIWLVPVLAAIIAAYYVYDHRQDRGPRITIRFSDATGLKAGESQIVHRGVQIGQVSGVELSGDRKQVLVRVQLRRSESAFARKGSIFWMVRPEISTQEISGLGTVLSGPLIDSAPGDGPAQTEFTGLDKPPPPMVDGVTIVLKTPHSQRLQPQSPLYFRGIQVGFVQDVQLSADATTADIHALIQRRYVPLIKTNSQFWVVSGVDLKGGIFTGIDLKVESLRALLSGGITFATPQEKAGEPIQNGAAFALYDEPQKDWLTWAPKIAIPPGDQVPGESQLPPPPQSAHTLAGSN